MKYYYALIILFSNSLFVVSQTNYYINQQSGLDSNNGLSIGNAFKTMDEAKTHLSPGDTLFFIGEFKNDNYNPTFTYDSNINNAHIWHQENTIRINGLHGTAGNYITLKAFNENTVLKGDGANIFRMTNCSYIIIDGLEIYGEVENIPLSTALSLQFLYRESGSANTLYRVPEGSTAEFVEANYSTEGSLPKLSNISRPSYTDTRGIYLSNVHHIDILNLKVHDTPGNGFRVADCDYINIIGNEVYNTSRKSYSGTHGLVVTNANSDIQGTPDTNDGYKIFIQKNKVYHNYNEIYSWAPDKTFITPKIDEGKGISLQRNDIDDNGTPSNTSDDTGWLHGRILVENNLCYWNGYSGIHSNNGLRIDFINNTCYLNSYTNTITNAGGNQSGKNIGASAQGGDGNKFINNIIFIDNAWDGFPISIASETNVEISNNLVFGMNGAINQDNDAPSQTVGDPLFNDVSAFDFGLQSTSPAIGIANTSFAPTKDYTGMARDSNPDLGALEYFGSLAIAEFQIDEIKVFPNPFKDQITVLQKNTQIKNIAIYNVLGQKQNFDYSVDSNSVTLKLNQLPDGIYLLKVGSTSKKIIKVN